MKRHVWLLALSIATALTAADVRPAAAACPYSSIQVRVQLNTSMPWVTHTPVPLNGSVHIGVFKNGWGVPVDPGTVQVWAVQGSLALPVSLSNGWEGYHSASNQSNWTFEANCSGVIGRATAAYGHQIDVLSYILPNAPTGLQASWITDKGNPWRTFSNAGGNVGERLPGFFITKGNVDYNNPITAWNYEQMLYDASWIYLLRDTSWTARCLDNQREAGMLLFTYENNQWLRGGRHFPRYINNGTSVPTGNKYIQGVEKKLYAGDSAAQEGRWCNAEFSGWTSSTIRGEIVPYVVIGGQPFSDVLKLSVVGGSGANDSWWYARGYGFVKFADANQTEQYARPENPYAIGVRIPCAPAAPCM